jgi:hypothetical protein
VSRASAREQCAELDKRIPLPTPASYLTLAGATRELIAAGTLVLVEGSVPLESLQPGQPLPSDGTDSIRHPAACATCGRRYVLWADTYHGGGTWEPSIGRKRNGCRTDRSDLSVEFSAQSRCA